MIGKLLSEQKVTPSLEGALNVTVMKEKIIIM